MDGVDEADVAAAGAAALGVPGVEDVTVRGRWTGRSLRLDLEAHLDPRLTLETAETIAASLEEAVQNAVPAVRHVSVVPRSASMPDHRVDTFS
jgi:divalent metal cation (Fe/Co/Zn/Cd) transporter